VSLPAESVVNGKWDIYRCCSGHSLGRELDFHWKGCVHYSVSSLGRQLRRYLAKPVVITGVEGFIIGKDRIFVVLLITSAVVVGATGAVDGAQGASRGGSNRILVLQHGPRPAGSKVNQ
jgi:hypothetical protein